MHSPPPKQHHYAIEAAELLNECRENLRAIVDLGKEENTNANILDLDRTLLTTEQILHYHLLSLLEQERGLLSKQEAWEDGNGQLMSNSSGGQQNPNYGFDVSETQRILHDTTTNEKKFENDSTVNFGYSFQSPSAFEESTHDLDTSNHAVTLEPIMETVEKLKSVMNQKHKRKRSISFLHWHKKNEQEIEQMNHQQKLQQHLKSSLETKNYTTALKAAQKNVSNDCVEFPGSLFNKANIDLNSARNTNLNFQNDYQKSPPFALPTNSKLAPQSITNNSNIRGEKTAIDSVLFRLIVVLQLCLVRIEEARNLLCSKRQIVMTKNETFQGDVGKRKNEIQPNEYFKWTKWGWGTVAALFGASAYFLTNCETAKTSAKSADQERRITMIKSGTKALGICGTSLFLRRCWRMLCMNARLLNTIFAIEDLHHQWMLVHSVQMDTNGLITRNDTSEKQCQRLLKLIPFQKSNHSIWGSEGAIRYGIIKWGMDTLYASVGTAIKVTKYSKTNKSSIMLPITAAAAASYYAITGASGKSAEYVSSSSESSDVIRNAWGVVSLPAVKTLSLQASRLLKGAAIAERIRICGVSCFVLSKNPCPVLATAIKRYRRRQERELSRLSMIPECEELTYSQRAINLNEYPRKDVIFHLTGGGFFAHTIAGDVPYLLDWSKVTNAVVVCPEYALLPEHTYPVAIEEVTRVYTSLVNGNTAALLGFQTDRIIVTGESTGGNLATSLCVKLCLDGLVDVEALTAEKRLHQASEYADDSTTKSMSAATSISESDDDIKPMQNQSKLGMVRLPDALMLCCPALNLSLELSPSRVLGIRDAVLPSSLISTISDAYVPQGSNVSKSNPLVSPFYASDEILRIFPPTLLYASSEDPLLDDSVYFNGRLRSNGVDSDLRAAQNVPHAYWGLGTAGFPEARKAQRECQQWMAKQLSYK